MYVQLLISELCNWWKDKTEIIKLDVTDNIAYPGNMGVPWDVCNGYLF